MRAKLTDKQIKKIAKKVQGQDRIKELWEEGGSRDQEALVQELVWEIRGELAGYVMQRLESEGYSDDQINLIYDELVNLIATQGLE